jgi:chemotaxis methyl-accepting protein methylase
MPRALDALLIGVTEFFRDAAVFASLRDDVLPALARTGRPLRVWSAACSTGAELYSVAMLLAESGRLAGARLLGTDCRPGAVGSARSGRYSAAEVKRIPAALAGRYLRPEGDGFRIALPEADIRWRTADLGRSVEPGPWDLILFRNTAIYMEPAAAGRVWAALAQVLAPGGALVTGRAERPHIESLGPLRSCICRKGDTAP